VVIIYSILIFLFANWLIYRRSKMLPIAIFSIFFAMSWMLSSAIYIDSSRAVYAEELLRRIGGGISSVRLALMYLMFSTALLFVFTSSRLARLTKAADRKPLRIIKVNGVRLDYIATAVMALFVICLYVKLFQGPVPLLTGMDRYSYKMKYGHFLLNFLYKYKDFIGFFSGVLFYYQCRDLRNKAKNFTFALFLSIIFYFVLIGNKFSSPFFTLCMFIIPLGLMILKKPKWHSSLRLGSRRISSAYLLFFTVAIVAIGLFGFALYKYYTRSWDPEEARARLIQRVLVKQGQIWWSTNKRVCEQGHWDSAEAFSRVFTNPFFGTGGNTSLQYLMYKEIGARKLLYHMKGGYLYTGAYPAILLELFGPYLSYFAAFLIASIFAILLYMFFRAVVQQHFLSVFFIAFVMHPFLFCHLGGKLYFLMNWKYGVKVALLFFALLYDNRHLFMAPAKTIRQTRRRT